MSNWILVVDDDMLNLRVAEDILISKGMEVTCKASGEEALLFLQDNKPDLVLLDIHMQGIDGLETLKEIRKRHELDRIPVIFLTADEDSETETTGLTMGASDFIKKPFVPEVLYVRVRNTIELNRLQNNLSSEVIRKTAEIVKQQARIERMSLQIVQTLSSVIDAKDTYTEGHSERVAEYSKEIAKRAGFSEKDQNSIYIMGLLHDVGKIGIPDSIINKPGSLTEEEYDVIKRHPVVGAHILKNITEFPELVTGARWHHERYDGMGYPDGFSGGNIPVEARIICVADAYDAMTSRRSYRNILTQEIVKLEIEKGKGTQFDPFFADIMLAMIEEDKEYKMKQ